MNVQLDIFPSCSHDLHFTKTKILSMLSELFPRPQLQPTLNRQPSPLKSILNTRLFRKPERKMSVCSAVSSESLQCLSSCWFFQTTAVMDCFTVCQVKDQLSKTGMILRHENGSVGKKVRRIRPLSGCLWVPLEENIVKYYKYFIFKSINLVHFERKIKQNYKTLWMNNKVSIHGHIMLHCMHNMCL